MPRGLERWAPRCRINDDGVIEVKCRPLGEEQRQWLIWVPVDLRLDVMRDSHSSASAAHRGVACTWYAIRRHYTWRGVFPEVREFVRRCDTCQRAKNPVHWKKSLLQPLPIPTSPNERVHCDLLTNLQTREGVAHVLVATDAFTKSAVTVLLRDKTAKTVAKALFEHWITRFSIPATVVTDRGREFTGAVVAELCRLLGVKSVYTSPAHAQSNSSAESFNRRIIAFFKQITDLQPLDWPDYLPALEFAYNCTYHSTIACSPFFMTYGRSPRLPSSIYREENPEEQAMMANPMSLDFFNRLRRTFLRAKAETQKSQAENKKYYDKRAEEKDFKVGDFLLVHYPTMNLKTKVKKFSVNWFGPVRCTRVMGNNNFEVQRLSSGKKMTIHADRLKLYLFNHFEDDFVLEEDVASSEEAIEQGVPEQRAESGGRSQEPVVVVAPEEEQTHQQLMEDEQEAVPTQMMGDAAEAVDEPEDFLEVEQQQAETAEEEDEAAADPAEDPPSPPPPPRRPPNRYATRATSQVEDIWETAWPRVPIERVPRSQRRRDV